MSSKRRKCTCDECAKWIPLHRRIMRKLSPRDRALYEEFLDKEEAESLDLGVANAKLAGDWPGWEWMKRVVKRHAATAVLLVALQATASTSEFSAPDSAVVELIGRLRVVPEPKVTTLWLVFLVVLCAIQAKRWSARK